MRLLPSERQEVIREINAELLRTDITEEMKEHGYRVGPAIRLGFAEPCDCGAHIRHFNGGNYHERVTIAVDSGRFFIKRETTCELEPPAEWEEVSAEDLVPIIEECSDWFRVCTKDAR